MARCIATRRNFRIFALALALADLLLAHAVVLQGNSKSGDLFERWKRQIKKVSVCPVACSCNVRNNGEKVVDCYSTGMKAIPVKIPGDAAQLHLSYNSITEVKDGYLYELRDLQKLDLSHNAIETITDKSFKDLGRLAWLDLSFNQLSNFTASNLGQARRSLQTLNMSSANLSDFPKLHDDKGAFMTNLLYLDLSHNFFTSVPSGHIPSSVQYLDISCLEVKRLSESFGSLQKLKELKIAGCSEQKVKLAYVSDSAFDGLTELTRLDLSGNAINVIPAILPKNLVYLKLSLNRISRIKATACATELEIKRSFLQRGYAEQNLGEIPGPNCVSETPNPATSPECSLPGVFMQDLSKDRQQAVCTTLFNDSEKHGLAGWKFCDALSKSFRAHPRVGSHVSRLTFLRQLELDGNPIQRICRDDFMNMHTLKAYYDVSGAEAAFKTIQKLFSNLSNLKKVLNMTGCSLTSFPKDAFLYAESLSKLDLSWNRIRTFEMLSMADLKELYVQQNYISEVHGITAATFPALAKADFSFNKYKCDCKLKQFIKFLAYAPQATFAHLHPNSHKYTCKEPANLDGTNLMKVNLDEDLVCKIAEKPVPLFAILAPVSLVAVIGLIVLAICVARYCPSKCGCCCSESPSNSVKVVSDMVEHDEKSDVVIKNSACNDAAVLCHTSNHEWVMKTMMPKIQQKVNCAVNTSHSYNESECDSRQLSIDVITIGKTIKESNLRQCLEVNKKIALVVTHEFLAEKSCLHVLQVLHGRMNGAGPPDAVIVVVLDALDWSELPDTLQVVMAEKSFVQYPDKDRERQEFYFWDTLSSLICGSDSVSKRSYASDNEDVAEEETVVSFQHSISHRDVADFPTIRSSRRSRSVHDELPDLPLSPARAARLQRLGITRNGEVVDDGMNEVAEARQLGKRNYYRRELAVINRPALDAAPSRVPSTRRRSSLHDAMSRTNATTLDEDIDDLYSTRSQPKRFENPSKVRSLLPPNCEDADSIYSDDDLERPATGFEIRPPDRHRRTASSRKTSVSGRVSQAQSNCVPLPPRGIRLTSYTSQQSSFTKNDVLKNLHGTMNVSYVNHPETNDVIETAAEAETDAKVESRDKPPAKKRKWKIPKLKLFF